MAQQVMFNSASIEASVLKLGRPRRQVLRFNCRRGFTLIEMIVFIAVVSIALVGILLVLNVTVAKSADPMIRKNMLSIAESLLEEVELMPMTYCDPSTLADPNQVWATATSTASCTSATPAAIVQGLGPGNSEARVSPTNPYNPNNNVGDYSGGSQGAVISGVGAGLGTWLTGATPITDITGNFSAPVGYYATIGLTAEPLGGIASTAAPATMNVVRITVTVYYGSNSIVVEGYRARYFPNNLAWQ
jgi:MSHA pilin protein MshD